jgi:hypothetical protein
MPDLSVAARNTGLNLQMQSASVAQADTMRALRTADRALAVADLHVDDIHTIDAMATEWFGEIMPSDSDGVALLEMAPTEKHDGMIDRMAVSLQWNDIGVGARLPSAGFVKATPAHFEYRKTMSILHTGEIEVSTVLFDRHPQTSLLTLTLRVAVSGGGSRSFPRT